MTATMTTGRSLGYEQEGRYEAERATPRRRGALLAVAGGLALLVSSAGLAVAAHAGPATQPARPGAAVAEAPVASPPNIGTASETYAPGHSSGWHMHPGVHSVVVLSGTLTIYDEHCVRTNYGPGDTYLGGNKPHLARNEGTADLDVAITYVFSSTSETPGTPVAAPDGCDAR